jgi:hypothetical protein
MTRDKEHNLSYDDEEIVQEARSLGYSLQKFVKSSKSVAVIKCNCCSCTPLITTSYSSAITRATCATRLAHAMYVIRKAI